MPRRPKLRIARSCVALGLYTFGGGGCGVWECQNGDWLPDNMGQDVSADFVHALWPHLKMKPGDGPREVDPDTMRFVEGD